MLKVNKSEVLKYIPKCEEGSKEPTIICYTPMTKRKFDQYIAAISSFDRGKTITHVERISEELFRATLTPDENGVYIYNVYIDGVFKKEIRDLNEAVQFLLNLTDIDTASEIEQVLRGSSMLSPSEEKN